MTSYIEAAALEALRIMKGKNSDYAPTTEFSNFEKAAEYAGVTVEEAIDVMIGIKMTRAEALSDGRQINNEALDDTLMDWQNYINIRRAWRIKNSTQEDPNPPSIEGYM